MQLIKGFALVILAIVAIALRIGNSTNRTQSKDEQCTANRESSPICAICGLSNAIERG